MADLAPLQSPVGIALTLGIWAAYSGSVLYLYVVLRRIPADLVQLMVFRKLDLLQRGVLLMSVGLILASLAVLLLILVPGLVLAPLAVIFAAGLALFGYGMFCYSRVFHYQRPGKGA